MTTVTRDTRAPRDGRIIICPRCQHKTGPVYHFAWTDLGCMNCKGMIPKKNWIIDITSGH